jgi:adenosylcobinamide-GDP ribazoletransferase
MLQGFIMAFSMYSRIPMPKIEWNKKNMKYAIACFPFVGLVVAACTGIWLYFAPVFHFSRLFTSIIALLIPFLVTGNIHFDGFLDTLDALSSHQEKEKKLEILKDSHIGAFACMGAVFYLLLLLAVWYDLYPFFTTDTEIDMTIICMIMLTYVISRCFSGLSVLTFPKAKNTGLAASFSSAASLKGSKMLLLVILFLCCLFEFFLQPMLSGVILAVGVIFFFYYRLIALKEFGGITGDLAGWFLQNCELLLLAVLLIGCKFYY